MKPVLVTAALPYANGPVHIGHLAGCFIPADVYVRFLRMKGEDVKFVCGSDEHGVPITIKAKNECVTPKQIVDKYHTMMKDAFAEFGISFDIYSRTSNQLHHETAADFFKTLYDKDAFTEQVTEQYYDEEAKQFLADRYIEGTCPRCGNENAYGDQCEKCGSSLSPSDLINPKSKLSGTQPVLKSTKHWFLPLNEYTSWLREWILQEHIHDWKPNVLGQCKSWIESGDGLQPRAMTRDLDWGVKVPLPDAEGKVLYVWFDAPIGYISATKELLPDTWERYWKNDDTRLIHFIGKDNIVFHCIIFPCILKAHGGYILPENVPANEFLNLQGDKISTSRNWAVWLHEYLKDFPGKQDVLRYTLIATAPETKDNDFTWKDFQARNNNELVAIFGNFVNRTFVLSHNYLEGRVPERGKLTPADEELLNSLPKMADAIAQSLNRYRFREALATLMDLARAGNKYLADHEPWKLIKTDQERTGTILNISLELCAWLSHLAEPFLPATGARLRKMLGQQIGIWPDQQQSLLSGIQAIQPAELLFEKIDDAQIQLQLDRLQAIKSAAIAAAAAAEVSAPVALKEEVQFDQFLKMDIRVGTILEAERVPKTDKLLKLLVDIGTERRTIVSGIAGSYAPEDAIGRQVVILVNLQPRKIKGIESKGMVLMASGKDGQLRFVSPDRQTESGSEVS